MPPNVMGSMGLFHIGGHKPVKMASRNLNIVLRQSCNELSLPVMRDWVMGDGSQKVGTWCIPCNQGNHSQRTVSELSNSVCADSSTWKASGFQGWVLRTFFSLELLKRQVTGKKKEAVLRIQIVLLLAHQPVLRVVGEKRYKITQDQPWEPRWWTHRSKSLHALSLLLDYVTECCCDSHTRRLICAFL